MLIDLLPNFNSGENIDYIFRVSIISTKKEMNSFSNLHENDLKFFSNSYRDILGLNVICSL